MIYDREVLPVDFGRHVGGKTVVESFVLLTGVFDRVR
jgi:hypothetical protein